MKKRAHELWSSDDKNTFFEALNEYGKDFDAIAKYMMSKVKKKGGSGDHASKTRAQVRCFYYRTWHKIAKHLNFPEGMTEECSFIGIIGIWFYSTEKNNSVTFA